MSLANPKPFASLSSALLARKGQARPAMRPQGLVSLTQPVSIVDDLGWNDMGEDVPDAPPVPPVLVQREALREEFAPAPEPKAEPEIIAAAPEFAAEAQPIETAAPPASLVPLPARTRKAAFTLRLDADRHLRLRLASASRHRSAQTLVTQALDAFLATLPDVEELAQRLSDAGDLK